MLKETLYCERNQTYDRKLVSKLSEELSLSCITARVLVNRGIRSVEEAEAFLYPNRNMLHDPFKLPDIEEAVQRIREAIECDERICIYGDYDTDGVCATAILYKTLTGLGANVEYFIPDRHTDGYGMHKSSVERLCDIENDGLNGFDLIITVDNGITAIDEIALCTEYCTDVIVTDHHLPRKLMQDEEIPEGAYVLEDGRKIIPDCVAVVVPTRSDSKYPFRYLCGSGVALKLSAALTGRLDNELLGLAAIATIADVVSVSGENRAIVKMGLPYIKENPGIELLLENAGVEGDVDEQTIGFVISPRINAAGRMGDASRAVRLLTTDDPEERVNLSDMLQADNERRRSEEARVLQDIFNNHTAEELSGSKVIVLKGDDWNPGVLGIAANKLEEQFYCPVILFTNQNGNLVGSGRSIDSIHLHELLTPLQHYFVRFGGHAMAVGITIPDEESLNGFIFDLQAICSGIDDSQYIKRIEYDETVRISDVSVSLYDELATLAPFGEGNPYPIFRSAELLPASFRKIGKSEDHLDGVFSSKEARLPFIGFKMGDRFETLDAKSRYDVLYSLMKDTFREPVSVKARLVDFKETDQISAGKKNDAFLSKEEYNLLCRFNLFSRRFLRPERFETIDRQEFDREHMLQSYRRIGALIGSASKQDISVAERIRLCVFLELGHFVIDIDGKLALPKEKAKRSLTESAIYKLIMPR